MRKAKKGGDQRAGAKQPYRKPRLATHGDIRDLTLTKGSNKADGSKPSTRATGVAG